MTATKTPTRSRKAPPAKPHKAKRLPNGQPDRAPHVHPTPDSVFSAGLDVDKMRQYIAANPDDANVVTPHNVDVICCNVARLAQLTDGAKAALQANENPAAYMARMMKSVGIILQQMAELQALCELVPANAWAKPEADTNAEE